MTYTMTMGDLEKKLLDIFPAEDACEWDSTGLSVGCKDAEIKKILVALDPTVKNIMHAKEIGANLLLTHHPPLLFDVPKKFLDGISPAQSMGAAIYRAASEHVALMNFHTTLDFNPLGYKRVPELLGFEVASLLDELGGSTNENGYGAICKVDEKIKTVRDVANRCNDVLGEHVCVFGDVDQKIDHIIWGQGSGNSLTEQIARYEGERCTGCFITGEIKYNPAMDLAHANIPVILLGHDVSEQPFVDLLYEQALSVGVPEDMLERLYVKNWTCI